MKRRYLMLMFSCLLQSYPALAQPPALQPQTQGEVTFVSGGVGADEQAAMQAMRGDYNLSLLFAAQGGEYLSDVDVHITDAHGHSYLETVSDGPRLMAKLRPGRYIVSVERDGRAMRKTVSVGGRQSAPVSFVWPQQKGD